MLMRKSRACTCTEVPRVMAAVKSGKMNCCVAWVMKPANAASLIVTLTSATSAEFKKNPAVMVTMSEKEAATAPTTTNAAALLRKTGARLCRPDHLRPDLAPSSPMSHAWATATIVFIITKAQST